MKSKHFTRRGNAMGFTSDGRAIVGQYRPKISAWQVWAQGDTLSLANPTIRTFTLASDADAYAESLMDAAKTAELKWWGQ